MRKLIFKRDGIGPGREVSKRMKNDWVAGYVMVDTISAAGCAKNLKPTCVYNQTSVSSSSVRFAGVMSQIS